MVMLMDWLLDWFHQQYMNQFKVPSSSLSNINLPSNFNNYYELFASSQQQQYNSSNNDGIQVNGTRCHPILFNSGGISMEPENPKFEYGICPDTIFTVIFTGITLAFSLGFLIFGLIGIIKKRKSGHIKARNPILMVSTLVASFSFVLISTLRYLVGRKIFPCALFALTFFIIVPLIIIPTLLRSVRLYCMFKLNMIKVGNKRMSTSSVPTNLAMNTSQVSATALRLDLNKVEPVTTTTDQQTAQMQQSDFASPADSSTTTDQTTQLQQSETPTSGNDSPQPAQQQTSTTPRSVKFQEAKSSNIDTVEPYDSWNEVSDIDILSDIASDYAPHMMEEADLKKIRILTFLTSNKFIVITYAVLIPIHLAFWLVLGGIEEGIFERDPTQKRVFLEDGGLLMFSHGCITNYKTVIIIVVQAVLYILAEIILLIFCVFADRDTWKIKIETFVVVIFQFTFTVLFGCEQISVIYTLIEFIFPSGNVMATATVIEVFISVILPLIYSIIRDERAKKYSGESDLEKVLKNKRMFAKLLEFSRKSYCPENILCFKDIQIYKRLKQPGKKKMADYICQTYLRQFAPLELNMPHSETRYDDIMGKLERKETLEKNLFDYLSVTCLNNMQDVFERLKETDSSVKDFINTK
ncbi:predicted protein [Naegleria gruberi]|uniref:Predicted protein n=1 Tax=Naegleria gruberi TaxID=5762 RepID=D2VZJ2_NAEGR|nr:uncharacterized protein NAEGRDRAFT_59680 [Naegleria gruberi]EFC37800.1 predicted protein [Naegleria gruberi]|eukprot:XP_002670544.1 predicted protein [Naegleria gruberi strain NEG-M]